MTADEIRAALWGVQRETHEICEWELVPGTPPAMPGHLDRIDCVTQSLTARSDAELVSRYEMFVRDRAVISWLHDEAALIRLPGDPK